MRRPQLLIALFPALLLAPRAAAQAVHWSVAGEAFDELGRTLAAVGDLDGDGVGDWAATTWLSGQYVRVGSGATGATLYQWDRPASTLPSGYYGRAVAGVGDVNADGVPDVVVGGSRTSDSTGFVELRSGADGALLATWLAPTGSGNFGLFVGAAGDLDQDGRDDVLVGDPYQGPNGRLEVRSGATGDLLRGWAGAGARRVGYRALRLGDVDGDGLPDYALCVLPPGEDDGPGLVRIHSGGSGALLRELSSGSTGYGWIHGLGDLDGDGVVDFSVREAGPYMPTRLEVRSGATATVLVELTDPTLHSGFALDAVDATGVLPGVTGPVIAVTSPPPVPPASNVGGVAFFDVSTGDLLARLDGARAGEARGTELLAIDDVDGDGRRELLAFRPSVGEYDLRGLLRLLDLDCGGVSRVCLSAPNSLGPDGARIYAGPLTSVSENELVLNAAGVPFGPHLYIASETSAQLPFGDGWRCVGGQVVRLGSAAQQFGGTGTPFPLDLSAAGPIDAQPGSTWYVQLWYRDPQGGPAGFNLSDALALVICP